MTTVNEVVPWTAPKAAVIVALPVLSPLASPPIFIVATAGADDIQATEEVISWVVPSLYVPVALNCTGKPAGIVWFAGVTAIETGSGGPTVTVVEPHTAPAQALTVTEPGAAAWAAPGLLESLLMLMTA